MVNRSIRALAWVCFAATAYLILEEAIWPWFRLPGLGNIGFTLVFVLFSLIHCTAIEGLRRTALFFAVSAVVSYLMEEIGVRTGLIYGAYHYSNLLGAKFGHVPILIPLAWFMMIYPSWMVAVALTRGGRAPSVPGITALAAVAAMVMTGWDMVMDPGMAAAGNWIWEKGGSYFGVPRHNYLGWLATTFLVYCVVGWLWRKKDNGLVGTTTFRSLPILVYALFALRYVASNRIPALQVVAVFSMGMPALVALIQVYLNQEATAVAAGVRLSPAWWFRNRFAGVPIEEERPESPKGESVPEALQIPEELDRLATQTRVLVRRGGPPRKDGLCVVYWMQRAMRIVDNPALDVAIEAGNILGLPVVVFFAVIPNHPNANLRHYHFMAQGLRDVAEDAAARGIGFVLRRPPDHAVDGFLEEVQAALVIGDESPCREPERWRQVLAKRLRLPYWTVDADVVVPSAVFNRSFVLLHHFRPHLKAQLPTYLVVPPNLAPIHEWKPWKEMGSYPVGPELSGEEITEGFKRLSRKVSPVDSFTGGTHAALQRLGEFVNLELGAYEEARNHPEMRGTSRLSPYLTFGHIGPLTIALAVEEAVKQGKASASARERFLDQLIGWRELSVLFVRHEANYDSWECAAPWAQKTLVEHAGDPRPQHYTLTQLERAETADEMWNAAQRQMVQTGWMHGYMRMYWAKKLLEWAPDPSRAFEWAVTLNDRYELDGRDPNGYAGIAWAIVGKHDRPWFNRPVFGLVRTMMGASTAKKFDAVSYIRQNGGKGEKLVF
jgi:deoxyribodipyrimidine photo-lyase